MKKLKLKLKLKSDLISFFWFLIRVPIYGFLSYLTLIYIYVVLLKSIFFIVHMNHTDAIEADFPAITICAPSILSPKNMSGMLFQLI